MRYTFLLILILAAGTARAQLDVVTVEGGDLPVGEPTTFDIYFRDASGTSADFNSNLEALFFFTFDATPGLIQSIDIVPAGIFDYEGPLFDTTLEEDRITWFFFEIGSVPNTTNLDAPLPGDLIARMTITTFPGTAGQELVLTPVPGPDEFFVQEAFLEQVLGDGELITDIGTFQITGANPPIIDNFQVDPTSIVTGGQSTLSWSVTGADSVTIDQGIGAVAGSGSIQVSPGSTTTYTINAENSSGAAQQSVTLTVTGPPPVINSFTASPSSIQRGQSATLAWDVTGATSVVIDQGVGTVPANGSTSVMPTGTITYTLEAQNSQGTTQQQVTLTVTDPPPNIGTFTVSPSLIERGQSSTLSWSVAEADTVTIDQGIGTVDPNGTTQVSPEQTTTYTITAQNVVGTVMDSVTLIVDQPAPPVIDSFQVNPSLIERGASATLSWSVSDAAQVSIDQGIGTVADSGSMSVSPAESTSYTITADNGFGDTVTSVATLTVSQSELTIISFTARPRFVVFGFETTLEWSVQGADAVTLSAETVEGMTDLGTVASQGQMDLVPAIDTTYTLTASAGDEQLSESVFVEVIADDALIFDPATILFGPDILERTLAIRNAIDRPLEWTLTSKPDWIQISSESGTVDGQGETLTLTLIPDVLPSGWTEDALVFTALDIPFEVPIQAGESLLVFPLVRSGNGFSTEVLAVNLENTAIDIELELFNPDGTIASSLVSANLAPQESFSYSVPETIQDGRGWVRIAVPGYREAALRGFADTRTDDGEERYAYPGVIPERGSILVPHIAADTNFYTLGSLVNISDFTDTFDFTAGAETFSIDTLPPGRQDLFDFRDELMEGQVRGDGWGTLFSGDPQTLMASVEVFGRSNQTSLRQSVGVSLDGESGTRLIFPHLAANTTVFWTGVVIINPDAEAANVTYRVYDEDGQMVTVPNPPSTIAPGAKQIFLLDRNRQDLGPGAAWLEVESDIPILGYMLFGSYAPDDFFSGFQSLKRGSENLLFPHIEPVENDQFTGIALVNLGSAETTVELELVDRAGNTRAQESETLGPKQKLVALARDLFAETFQIGDKILVHGSTDLAGFELFGAGRRTLGGILAMDYQDQQSKAK